jgi:serine/threonine protein kinase
MGFPDVVELRKSERRLLSDEGISATVYQLLDYPHIAVKAVHEARYLRREQRATDSLRNVFGFTDMRHYRETGLIVPFSESASYACFHKGRSCLTNVRDLFMPLMSFGSLANFLKSFKSEGNPIRNVTILSKIDIMNLFPKLASPLQLLHDNSLVHGDIREANYLLGEDGNEISVGLADFGLSLCEDKGSREFEK